MYYIAWEQLLDIRNEIVEIYGTTIMGEVGLFTMHNPQSEG